MYREDRVKDGVFQAMMDVALVNDGPVGNDSPVGNDGPVGIDGPVGVDYRCEDEAVRSPRNLLYWCMVG